jgi:isoleucyl-tRNA synthetase
MGLEDRAQQAPAIDIVIDDKNFGFHEGPPFKSGFAHGGVPDFL